MPDKPAFDLDIDAFRVGVQDTATLYDRVSAQFKSEHGTDPSGQAVLVVFFDDDKGHRGGGNG